MTIEIAHTMPPHTPEQIDAARRACARLPMFTFSLHDLLKGKLDDRNEVKAALLAIIGAEEMIERR